MSIHGNHWSLPNARVQLGVGRGAVAVRRRRRCVVVHACRPDPRRAAVRRPEVERVGVRAPIRAVPVVRHDQVEVVSEAGRHAVPALVDNDVAAGVDAEAAVREYRAAGLLSTRGAVRPVATRVRVVDIEDRRNKERPLERVATVHRADEQVLVLVGRVEVLERHSEQTRLLVHRRHRELAHVAELVADAERAEGRAAVNELRRRPRAALVVGVAEIDPPARRSNRVHVT